jgi:ectoine hydroxylase-related dioxygenase (phytanoyl-CoA dioxygenase family)
LLVWLIRLQRKISRQIGTERKMGNLQHLGYEVIRNAFPSTEVSRLKAELEPIIGDGADPLMTRPGNELFPLRWNHPAVIRLIDSFQFVTSVRDVLEGEDLRWISAYASIKQAHSCALAWHQDWWAWDHPVSLRPAPTQVAVLCYLQSTEVESGAPRVLPGSHRRGTALHSWLPEAHSERARNLPPSHPAMNDALGQETIAMNVGDALAIDYRLLHGTHPNRSERRRDALLLSFVPSWCSLPEALKAHFAQHPALPNGEERKQLKIPSVVAPPHGSHRSITLNRTVPEDFRVGDSAPAAAGTPLFDNRRRNRITRSS